MYQPFYSSKYLLFSQTDYILELVCELGTAQHSAATINKYGWEAPRVGSRDQSRMMHGLESPNIGAGQLHCRLRKR